MPKEKTILLGIDKSNHNDLSYKYEYLLTILEL